MFGNMVLFYQILVYRVLGLFYDIFLVTKPSKRKQCSSSRRLRLLSRLKSDSKKKGVANLRGFTSFHHVSPHRSLETKRPSLSALSERSFLSQASIEVNSAKKGLDSNRLRLGHICHRKKSILPMLPSHALPLQKIQVTTKVKQLMQKGKPDKQTSPTTQHQPNTTKHPHPLLLNKQQPFRCLLSAVSVFRVDDLRSWDMRESEHR